MQVVDARFSVAMITLQVAATNGATTAVVGVEDGHESGSDDGMSSIMAARREAKRWYVVGLE